jgi:hypothetical protein
LFQPSKAVDPQPHLTAITPPLYIQSALSIFLPLYQSSNRYHQRTVQQDERLVLEVPETSIDPKNITMAQLLLAISHASTGSIVLFTSEKSPKVAVGVYFPEPNTDQEGQNSDQKASFLFQLQPKYRILGGVDGRLTVRGMESKSQTLLGMEESEATDNSPYWIGDPNDQGSGLNIDPKNRTVRLVSGDGKRGVENRVDEKRWEVVVEEARMDILIVMRGMKGIPSSGGERIEQVVDNLEKRVSPQELQKRIQGFGSR